jgi:hypothetical protein
MGGMDVKNARHFKKGVLYRDGGIGFKSQKLEPQPDDISQY